MFIRNPFVMFKRCVHGKFGTNVVVLEKALEINYSAAYRVINKYPLIKSVEPVKLTFSIQRLKKLRYTKKEILEYPTILVVNDTTLMHQYNLLKEVGFSKVSIEHLLNFSTILKKNVALLKAHSLIPELHRVPKVLLNYCKPKVKNVVVNDLYDDRPLKEIIHTVLTRYLVLNMDTTEAELERLGKIYPFVYHRSFRLLCENINFMRSKGFTNEKILKHWYLIAGNSEQIQAVFTKFPTLCGVKMEKIVKRHPKILITDPYKIQEIYDILQKHNIPDSSISKAFVVFTLSSATVEKRLKDISLIPQLKVLEHHPRILQLVLSQNKARSRVSYLKHFSHTQLTLPLLCTHEASFEKFINEGYKTFGKDTINFICTELNVDVEGIRNVLKIQPHWTEIPLTRISDSLQYLRIQKRFSDDDLIRVPYVLFYPRERIAEAYAQIRNDEALRDKVLTNKQMLNLLLYFMEQPYHFTGNGVWCINEQKDKKHENLMQ